MVHLLLHCLIKANHAPKVWRGIPIDRGQFITGLDSLSRETGISVRSIRTCLKRMEGKELTSKTTNKFRVITINNYSTYQDAFDLNDKLGDKQATSKRQANDKQATATNNDKNDKNDKNKEERVCVEENPGITAEVIYDAYPLKKGRGAGIKAIQKALKKIDSVSLLERVEIFAAKWQGKDKEFCPYPATWFNGDRWLDEDLAQSQVDFLSMDREEGKRYIAQYLVQAGVRHDDPYPAAIQKIQVYYDNGGFEI